MDVDLALYVGDTLARVARLRYELGRGQATDRSPDDALELTFASGRVLFCDTGPDGDTVRLSAQTWTDPFAEPLSPVNAEYVRTHGKWIRRDTSGEDPFADLVGNTLSDVAPMIGMTGRLYGLLLYFAGYPLAVYSPADELSVVLLT